MQICEAFSICHNKFFCFFKFVYVKQRKFPNEHETETHHLFTKKHVYHRSLELGAFETVLL